MNDYLNKIKDKIKNLISFNKIKPHEHWKYLVNIFFVLIFLLILISFYLMYQIKNQQIYQVNPTSSQETVLVNEKLLEKVKKSYLDKSLIQDEIKNGLRSYKDPSF